MVIVNAPHPAVIRRYLLRHPGQLLKSWYVFIFQIPGLPDFLLRVNHCQGLFFTVRAAGPGRLPDKLECTNLLRAWQVPHSITAMLNYYRALRQFTGQRPQELITTETLILFSTRDPAEQTGLAVASKDMCQRATIVWYEKARHWLHWERSSEVTSQIIRFFTASSWKEDAFIQ